MIQLIRFSQVRNMRMIRLFGTTDALPRIVSELPGKCSPSKEFVVLVALIVLDTQHGCALAPDPGGQNASHNAFFSRGIQRNLRAVRTRRSSHFAILQSRKAQTQSSKVLHCAR